jgi:hypothetical protein
METAASSEVRNAPSSYPTGPRLDPTRLRGARGNLRPYRDKPTFSAEPTPASAVGEN